MLLVHLAFGDVFVASPALAEPPSIVLGANPTESIVQGRGRGLRLESRVQGVTEAERAGDMFEKLEVSASECRFQGKILALTMDTFLPFSEFEGLLPGGPSRLDGRSARDSETIASVRAILAGRGP